TAEDAGQRYEAEGAAGGHHRGDGAGAGAGDGPAGAEDQAAEEVLALDRPAPWRENAAERGAPAAPLEQPEEDAGGRHCRAHDEVEEKSDRDRGREEGGGRDQAARRACGAPAEAVPGGAGAHPARAEADQQAAAEEDRYQGAEGQKLAQAAVAQAELGIAAQD